MISFESPTLGDERRSNTVGWRTDVKVFISQSLPRSLALAKTLESFIRKVVPGTDPWVSDSGVEKGSRFLSEIRQNLNEATAGIVCITDENRMEPWILYEAGALSTKVTDRVWTVLLDVDHTAVAPPLSGFNHTSAVDKADVLKMVRSIHKTMLVVQERTCSEADLEKYFDAFWATELAPTIDELRAQGPKQRAKPDALTEIRGMLREVGERVNRTAWRQDKTLAMMHHVYQTVVGRPAPGLSELKAQKFEAANVADQVRAALVDTSWQPQQGGTPLPLRNAAQQRQQPEVTVVDPSVVDPPVVDPPVVPPEPDQG
jgi:hypothetical protein